MLVDVVVLDTLLLLAEILILYLQAQLQAAAVLAVITLLKEAVVHIQVLAEEMAVQEGQVILAPTKVLVAVELVAMLVLVVVELVAMLVMVLAVRAAAAAAVVGALLVVILVMVAQAVAAASGCLVKAQAVLVE